MISDVSATISFTFNLGQLKAIFENGVTTKQEGQLFT